MRQYVEKRLELFMIETGEKLANVLAKGSSVLVTGLIALMGMLFLLLALAFFLGDLLGSMALGFSIVGVLLFTVALIVYLVAPEAIEENVRRRIADQFMDKPQKQVTGAGSGDSLNPIFNGTTQGNGSPADGSRPQKGAASGRTSSHQTEQTVSNEARRGQETTDYADDPAAIRRAVDAMANLDRTDTDYRNREQ
jgi:hypothetical protein